MNFETVDENETSATLTVKTKFGNWAFRFFIYSLGINLTLVYKFYYQQSIFENWEIYLIEIASILIHVFNLLGIVFVAIAFNNKEKQSVKLIIALLGHFLLLTATIYSLYIDLN